MAAVVHILQSRALAPLLTVMRDASTPNAAFGAHARRLMRLLAEEGIASLPASAASVTTPCGAFDGVELPDASAVCAVSIVRAGDALLEEVRAVWPAVSVGKLLIQRDEETALPRLFYAKLPAKIADKHVLLCDPMLATGGSAVMAIRLLVERGAQPSRIIFLNVLACPEGIAHVHDAFPEVAIVTCAVDARLDERKFLVPGLGDFGDRFYGTTDA